MRGLLFITIPLSLFLIYAAYNPTLIQGPETAGRPFNGDGTMLDPINLTSIIGGIFVFVFYWLKFARWPGPEGAPAGFRPFPTRHFTTWLRYVGWSFIYSSAMMVCYFMIILFPQTVINVFHILLTPDVAAHMPGVDSGIVSSLLPYLEESGGRLDPNTIVPYAIILVTLAWSSGFAKWERSFRRTLQESALIPSEAQRLVQFYEDDPERFSPKKKHIKRVLERFPNNLIVEEDFKDEKNRWLMKYAECEYMIERIRRLSGTRSFAPVINRYKNDLDEVKARADNLRDQLRLHREEISNDLRGALSRVSETKSLAVQSSDLAVPPKAVDSDESWNDNRISIPFARWYINRSELRLEKGLDTCLSESLEKERLKKLKNDLSNLEQSLDSYREKIKVKLRDTCSAELKKTEITFKKSDLEGPLALRDVYKYWKESESTIGFEPRYHNQAREKLEMIIDDCLHSTLQIVVCGVLAVCKSPKQRRFLLKKIGLKMPKDLDPTFGREEAVRAVLSIGFVMFICTTVFFFISSALAEYSTNPANVPVPSTLGHVLLWTIYALQMHFLGLFGGYTIQKSINANQLEEEDEDEDEEEDEGEKEAVRGKFYIADYAECFVFGFCLNIILLALLTVSAGQWGQFRMGWPWAIIPAITACFTGYYVSPACRLKRLRWVLVFTQGFGTSLVSLVIFFFIYSSDLINQTGKNLPLIVFGAYCMMTTLLIGMALSYNLQHWVRNPEEDKQPEEDRQPGGDKLPGKQKLPGKDKIEPEAQIA